MNEYSVVTVSVSSILTLQLNKYKIMKNYIKYNNGIRVDMMGNYHGGCKKSCCKNSLGFPTKKGISNNCKIKI